MKIDVLSATELQIDWLVATCEGLEVDVMTAKKQHPPECIIGLTLDQLSRLMARSTYLIGDRKTRPFRINYSTNWAQGGPILDREGMEFDHEQTDAFGRIIDCAPGEHIRAMCHTEYSEEPSYAKGKTLLIAGMRAYLINRLGRLAEVPHEII